MAKKEKGSNSHGFKNEKLLVDALNNKQIKDLKGSLLKFIKNICVDNNITVSEDMLIEARVEKSNKVKQDFYITIQEQEFGISVKMGVGNSVHQEKIEDFINWIDQNPLVKITDDIKNELRFYIWCDGTLDGKAPVKKGKNGKVEGRFGCAEFKKLYPEKRKTLQKFFEENANLILERAIFVGNNNSKVDYVYHGTEISGRWLSKKEIIEYNINYRKIPKNNKDAAINVGRLSVQPWNPSLSNKHIEKRGQLQLKYGCMQEDFENLMIMKVNNIGTFEGDQEELNLCRFMNKYKTHKFWNIIAETCRLEDDRDQYFVVKVEGNKKSNLCGKKVKCKADNFVIKANIDKNYLLQYEYQITEKMLKDIGDYKVIEGTGISVKKADSTNYTIIKLTNNTFEKAFENYIKDIRFITAGAILYSDKNQLFRNKKILKDLKMDQKELLDFYHKEYTIKGEGLEDIELIKKISKKSKEVVREAIEENKDLKMQLFTGKGWFQDPFCINFIFKEAKLTSNIYTDYTVSNGSGRSKGNYSIILKP